jgi:hypothetical protein
MSNPEHLKLIRSGKKQWNDWRASAPEVRPDLRGAKLRNLDLSYCDLDNADLRRASFWGCTLQGTRLNNADLSQCTARFVRFSRAKLAGAKLVESDLRGASLRKADLTGANLRKAVLRFASLVGATITDARLDRAEVYGIGAWNLVGEPKSQKDLVIREQEGAVTTTIDDLDTAQYLFMLRENHKISDIIDTASQRTVLLLGRFSPRYKKVLDALKSHLLARNFVPVLFDFKGPGGRDFTETVASLAHMACFVIPDLSGAKSVPQELSVIIPFLPSVPVLPVIARKNEEVYSMFEHFLRYPWVHEPVRYEDVDHLLRIVDKEIIEVGFLEAMKARGVKNPKLPALPETKAKEPTAAKTGRKRRTPAKKRRRRPTR